MSKIQFSDVTPPERRRSIRDIPIPSSKRKSSPTKTKPDITPKSSSQEENFIKITQKNTDPQADYSSVPENRNESAYEYYYPKERQVPGKYFNINKPKRGRFVFGGIAFLVIIGFIVGMMTIFASATIAITPKSQTIGVDMEIDASLEAGTEAVRYEIIKLAKTKSISVPATGEEVVELKSSGKIIVYNNFSTEPQRLIVRTRFESPKGLIYRIPESIVVPGKTVKDGKTVPGSIEVEVFADEAGEKYNIEKTDFTIPGFKNDSARYAGFYARSSTDLTGGFIGKKKTVLPADKETALQKIQSEIENELQKELQSKIPEDLALLQDSIIFKSKELPTKDESSSVLLEQEVTAYAVTLNTESLSEKIISEYIVNSSEWQGIEAVVQDFSGLKITSLPENPESGENIKLKISGTAKVRADIDTDVITQRLLNAPKKEAAKLIDEFAGISSVTSTLRPLWKQSFPKDTYRLHVEVVPK